MPTFGARSTRNLNTAHPDLQRLFLEVVKHYDCSILEGFRNDEAQNEAYAKGFSKLRYPESKHNEIPSKAVDVVPWFTQEPHIRWNDKEKFYEFAGFIQGVASQMGISIRQGINWDGDQDLHDSSFIDFPHTELR